MAGRTGGRGGVEGGGLPWILHAALSSGGTIITLGKAPRHLHTRRYCIYNHARQSGQDAVCGGLASSGCPVYGCLSSPADDTIGLLAPGAMDSLPCACRAQPVQGICFLL